MNFTDTVAPLLHAIFHHRGWETEALQVLAGTNGTLFWQP